MENKRTQELFRYLVGSSIEFRVPKGCEKPLKSLTGTKNKIVENTRLAELAGGVICISLLGEMANYYRHQTYYPMIRGSIVLGRYYERINDYLDTPTEERAERLIDLLRHEKPKFRDTIINAIGYFCGIYKSKRDMFSSYLNRSEKLFILSF